MSQQPNDATGGDRDGGDPWNPDADGEDPAYHGARAALYGAVAAPFLHPAEGALDELAHADAIDGLGTAAGRVGVEAETETFVDALVEGDRREVASAYDRLFGVPDPDGTYRVVPYEAHYTADGAIDREQRRIAAVVGVMEAAGLERTAGFAERQDHVAAELECAQVLAGQRAVARHSGNDTAADRLAVLEATFLAHHLAEFVPAFASDLRDATDVALYVAAADLASAIVAIDHARHPDPVDVPDESRARIDASERRSTSDRCGCGSGSSVDGCGSGSSGDEDRSRSSHGGRRPGSAHDEGRSLSSQGERRSSPGPNGSRSRPNRREDSSDPGGGRR
jgi:TorA-specific chaperone